MERDATNFERFKNYTFLERVEERRYGRNGNLSSKEIQTYEFMVLGGRPYGKLVERDDKALPAKEARKEQEKLEKESAKRQRESASDKAKEDKDRAEERRYLREVPEAFDLTIQGTEQIGGRPVWIIGAQPKSGYKPKIKRAEILTHLRGKIWVDQADYQWVKAEVDRDRCDFVRTRAGQARIRSRSELRSGPRERGSLASRRTSAFGPTPAWYTCKSCGRKWM